MKSVNLLVLGLSALENGTTSERNRGGDTRAVTDEHARSFMKLAVHFFLMVAKALIPFMSLVFIVSMSYVNQMLVRRVEKEEEDEHNGRGSEGSGKDKGGEDNGMMVEVVMTEQIKTVM